jgi:hypothetical protein
VVPRRSYLPRSLDEPTLVTIPEIGQLAEIKHILQIKTANVLLSTLQFSIISSEAEILGIAELVKDCTNIKTT